MNKKNIIRLIGFSFFAFLLVGCKKSETKDCKHIDANSDYKCDNCGIDMDVNEFDITTLPATRFIKGYEFSTSGMEVTYTHNGISSILSKEDYVVDYSLFDSNTIGEYEIKVSLKSDSSFYDTYIAKVVQITGISTNEDYRKEIIKDEDDELDDFNLKLYTDYSDGVKEEFTAFQYDVVNLELVTDVVGKQTVTANYLGYTCDISYRVIRSEDAKITNISLNPNMPFAIVNESLQSFIFELKHTYSYINVEFEEAPGKVFRIKSEANVSEFEAMNPENPHTATVEFTYNGSSIRANIEVISLDEYTFDKLEVSYDTDYDLYYKENMSNFEETYEIYCCYTKSGIETKTVKVPVSVYAFTRTSGDTSTIQNNVEFVYENKDFGSFTVTNDVLPIIKLEAGDYYEEYDISGFYVTDLIFHVDEEGNYSIYTTKEGEIAHLSSAEISYTRQKVYDGIDCLEINVTYTSLYSGNEVPFTIEIEIDSKKAHNLSHTSLSTGIASIYFKEMEATMFYPLSSSKFSEEQINTIVKSGKLHKCTIDNTDSHNLIVNVLEEVDIYGNIEPGLYTTVFTQQDATGMPFLGTYISTLTGEDNPFIKTVVCNDGIYFYYMDEDYSKSSYTYTLKGNSYILQTSFFGVSVIIEGDSLSFNYYNSTQEFTKETNE